MTSLSLFTFAFSFFSFCVALCLLFDLPLHHLLFILEQPSSCSWLLSFVYRLR
eukprot:m.153867 g.153867  ORF g.153867 m.153867 type:complete len:53 (-) comp16245_c1_seq1:88-246(-)